MYKRTLTGVRRDDGALIPADHANIDYVAYLAWVAEGNTPDPADVPNPNDAITAQIAALEAAAYLNRGSRELEMRLIEQAASGDATILAAQPYYVKLKAMDDEIRALREQLK